MHKGYLGFIDEKDDRWENEIRTWEETGIAPSECWNMDKVILKFLADRLNWYKDKDSGICCLNQKEMEEIFKIAKVFEEASEDFTGKVCFKNEWKKLGELLPRLWN